MSESTSGLGGSLTALYLQNPALATALRQQMFAKSFMEKGQEDTPIRSPWQGVSRMANAALGAYLMGKSNDQIKTAGDQQTKERGDFANSISALLANPQAQAPQPQPQAPALPQGGPDLSQGLDPKSPLAGGIGGQPGSVAAAPPSGAPDPTTAGQPLLTAQAGSGGLAPPSASDGPPPAVPPQPAQMAGPGAPPAPMPPQAGPDPLAHARKIQMLALKAASSTDPTIRAQAPELMAMAGQMLNVGKFRTNANGTQTDLVTNETKSAADPGKNYVKTEPGVYMSPGQTPVFQNPGRPLQLNDSSVIDGHGNQLAPPNPAGAGALKQAETAGAAAGTATQPPSAAVTGRYEQFGKLGDAAAGARDEIQHANLLKQTLHELGSTGPATPYLANLSRYAAQAGVPAETIKRFGLPNGASETEASALANGLAMEIARSGFPQRITNNDLQLAQSMKPNTAMPGAASDFLIDNTIIPKATRDIARYGSVVNMTKSGHADYDPSLGGMASKLYQFDQQNPLTSFTPKLGGANAPGARPTDEPPEPGAQKAPDGYWYRPNPNKPGKFQRINPL